jgi:ABC-type multidrug transport system fused ATPase/permease subunit
MSLLEILKRSKGGIAFAIILVLVEKIAWIIEPTVFGNVIDALIVAGQTPPGPSPLGALLLWSGVFAVNSGVGAFRRSWDERIYLKLYSEIAANVAATAKIQGLPVAKAAVRAELSREYITFFQYRIPEIIEQAIDIIGAVLFLWVFDWRLAVTSLGIIVPLLAINRIYNKRVTVFQKNIHDLREDIYNVFSTLDEDRVRTYYQGSARWQQKIANWGAINFGLMRLFLLFIFIAILYISIDLDEFSTGNMYSIAAYVWTFVTSSEYLPELMESWTSLKDLTRRFTKEEVA